ncbi:hypothetical protein VDGL01_09531 [Verticillium dahliae]
MRRRTLQALCSVPDRGHHEQWSYDGSPKPEFDRSVAYACPRSAEGLLANTADSDAVRQVKVNPAGTPHHSEYMYSVQLPALRELWTGSGLAQKAVHSRLGRSVCSVSKVGMQTDGAPRLRDVHLRPTVETELALMERETLLQVLSEVRLCPLIWRRRHAPSRHVKTIQSAFAPVQPLSTPWLQHPHGQCKAGERDSAIGVIGWDFGGGLHGLRGKSGDVAININKTSQSTRAEMRGAEIVLASSSPLLPVPPPPRWSPRDSL